MVKFIMMVGLPASGKSTIAEEIEQEYNLLGENIVLLSSDKLRVELYGDINNQENNGQIFEEMNKRTKDYLRRGINVIYDATNISSKRRLNMLKHQLKGISYKKECYYMVANWIDCICNDSFRDRQVGADVINKMKNNMQIPMYHEGWDEIKLINNNKKGEFNKWLDYFTYEYQSEFINIYRKWDLLHNCIEMPQDNPHHTFSLSRHMFRTYIKLKENGMVAFAGALHDIGKAFTKTFGDDGYAHYYNHDNISAQLSVEYMLRFTDFDSEKIIYISTLIQLHMRMFNREGLDKLSKLVDNKLYEDLQLLHNADISAK